MNHDVSDDLRYPVGTWTWPAEVTQEERAAFIRDIEALPAKRREAVAGLDPQHLDTPYRDGGWRLVRPLLKPAGGFVADVPGLLDRGAIPQGVTLWRL